MKQICSDCLHYYACAAWNIGSLANTEAGSCANYKSATDMRPVEKTRLTYQKAYKWYRCENCLKIYPERIMDAFNECEYQPKFNFCPNCGAYMQEVQGWK